MLIAIRTIIYPGCAYGSLLFDEGDTRAACDMDIIVNDCVLNVVTFNVRLNFDIPMHATNTRDLV